MIGWLQRRGRKVSAWVVQARAWRPPWADRRIKIAFTDQVPAKPKRGRLYVASSANGPTFGYLLCPCGCDETLHLRFLPNRSPRWDIHLDRGGVVSLTPSVWRQVGCRSHFVVERGRVIWC